MSLSPRKRELLSAFLGELPVAAAVKLFAAIEADRAKGGKRTGPALPYDAILTDLRAALARRGAPTPDRPRTAKRAFFDPIEDFFVSARRGRKRRAQISRTSLDPIWRVMMTDPALTEAAMAAASLDDAYAAGGDTKPLERAMFIAAEAGFGRVCARIAAQGPARDALAQELGGEDALADFEEIHLLLEGAEGLRALRAIAPSSTPQLTEEQYYDLRQLFLSVHEQSPQLAPYILLALKGRLEAPWRALGVYYHLAKSADERLVAAREAVSALPESLFDDLEGMARQLEKAGSGPLDAASAQARIKYFADYAEGLSRQASRAGDNVFVNRVEACRDIASEAHARFVEQALSAMRAAMPVRHSGASSKLAAPRPDFAKALAPEIVDEAASAVALIVGALEEARRLGGETGLVETIAADAAKEAKGYANDLVAEIRAAEGADRAAARRLLTQTLAIIEPMLKSDELGLIRDRAAAAAVTA